jgi:predicted transcriptional regulator
MATKAEIMKALEDLPEDATIDDAVERLVFMIAVEHGLAQAETGELIPHSEIVQLVKTWLK